jgi:hypothetical protein
MGHARGRRVSKADRLRMWAQCVLAIIDDVWELQCAAAVECTSRVPSHSIRCDHHLCCVPLHALAGTLAIKQQQEVTTQ